MVANKTDKFEVLGLIPMSGNVIMGLSIRFFSAAAAEPGFVIDGIRLAHITWDLEFDWLMWVY